MVYWRLHMKNNHLYKLGIDIGSTTVKIAILDENDQLLFSDYERHFANIRETLHGLVKEALDQIADCSISAVITGSGGLTLAKHLNVGYAKWYASTSIIKYTSCYALI